MSAKSFADADLSKRLARALGKAMTKDETASQRGPQQKRPEGRSAKNVVNLHQKSEAEPSLASPMVERWPLPGLAPMTRVRTIFGDVHSIALRRGDEVLTKSGEYLPIEWINRIKLDDAFLSRRPDSHPVVIGPGALGQNSELMVSPRQVIAKDDTSGLSSEREAAMLVSHAGIRRLRETGLTYTMFHVGEEANVYCEGLYLKFPMEA